GLTQNPARQETTRSVASGSTYASAGRASALLHGQVALLQKCESDVTGRRESLPAAALSSNTHRPVTRALSGPPSLPHESPSSNWPGGTMRGGFEHQPSRRQIIAAGAASVLTLSGGLGVAAPVVASGTVF